MNILSFDQAANLSGWSYWEKEKPVDWGVISPVPKSARGGQRLHSLRQQFMDLIKEKKPDIVLIENPVGGEEDKRSGPENNWKTMQVLCQVQGVLLETIDVCNKPVEIISPSSWQYTCGIHKRERGLRKAGAREFVKKTFKLDETQVSQDVVDSMCIAYHYIENNREERSAF